MQNGRHFPDNIFKCIFLNENVWILTKISIKFVPQGEVNNHDSTTGSDNGSVLARWQAIAWTNDGKFTDAYMRRSASVKS